MANARQGQSFNETLVATATSGADGRFQLRAEREAFWGTHLPAPGSRLVDLAIVSFYADGSMIRWYTSRVFLPQENRWADPSATSAAPRSTGLGTPVAQAGGGSAQQIVLSQRQAVAQPQGSEGPQFRACQTTFVREMGQVRVDLVEIHTQANARALVTYSNGASSTLGVGVQFVSSGGGFSAGGTFTRSATASVTFGSYNRPNTHARIATNFTYQHVRLRARGGLPGCTGGDRDELRPVRFVGGNASYAIPAPPKPPDAFCTQYKPGDEARFNSQRNSTFNTGVNLGAYGFGLNLSAQTGFTTEMSLLYTFTGPSHLCGRTALPGPGQFLSQWDRK